MIFALFLDLLRILGFLASHLPLPTTEKVENSRFLGRDCLGGGGLATHRSTAELGRLTKYPPAPLTHSPSSQFILAITWEWCLQNWNRSSATSWKWGKEGPQAASWGRGHLKENQPLRAKMCKAQKRDRWKFSFAVFQASYRAAFNRGFRAALCPLLGLLLQERRDRNWATRRAGPWTVFITTARMRLSIQLLSLFNSLRPYGLQHARLLCPSLSPGGCSNSHPLSQCCHPSVSSFVVPFSSCLQSFPA